MNAQVKRGYYQKYYQRNKGAVVKRATAWAKANLERRKEINKRNKDKNREKMKIVYQRTKEEVVELFGGKCVKCGFSDIRALQMDHVNGKKGMPRSIRKRGGHYLYRNIITGKVSKDLFQLLCANCNWIKRAENDEHRPYWSEKRET